MSSVQVLEALDLEAVDRIVDSYDDQKGALMPVLQDVNARYNYLPEEALRHIALRLDLPLSQVLHVATFYNVFSLEPRGRYVIRVCVGTSCHVRGGSRILESLQKHLGIPPDGTTPDMRFSLETVRCVGCCALSPCVVIGTETHARLRPDAVAALLKSHE